MKHITLDDLNILDIGVKIQLSGIIYSSEDTDYLCFLPDFVEDDHSLVCLDMSLSSWQKFFRQTDIMETEALAIATDGKIVKTIVRKAERQIDQFISWKVYARDKYTCRYCGATGIPLTVDHIVLWENGGPSIEQNLLTACKKCNKARGNTEYEDWLNSDYYRQVSTGVRPEVLTQNRRILLTIDSIPVRINRKSR
jgi:hypothetical protein